MRRRPTRSSLSVGFTLMEIMVVLVILGIIAAVAIPSALSTDDFQASSAARTVLNDLQYAQNVAITTQQAVTVTFDVSGNSYSLANASQVLKHPIRKDEDYVVDFSSQQGMGQVSLVSASFGGAASVTFDELGAPDNAGSVTVQAGSHQYRVDVAAATGNVSVTALGS